MSTTVEELVSACLAELQLSQRFVPYVQRAEEAGYPQLARLFRALVISETAREALLRKGLISHSTEPDPYFVCPTCGLVFHAGKPEKCPVDETAGETFVEVE
jgi:rubrerythrin